MGMTSYATVYKNKHKNFTTNHIKIDDSVMEAPAYCRSFLDNPYFCLRLIMYLKVLYSSVIFCNFCGGQIDRQTDRQTYRQT